MQVAKRNDIAGILPVLGRSPLGTPFPAELHSVEPNTLLVDYSFQQFQIAGFRKVYIAITPRAHDMFAKAIGWERRGIQIEYFSVGADRPEPEHYWHYVVRACRRASFSADYLRYFVLNPLLRIESPEWVRWATQNFEAPFAFDVPGSAFLEDDSVTDLRRIIKTEPHNPLPTCLGSRIHKPETPTLYRDLSNWGQAHQFIKEEF